MACGAARGGQLRAPPPLGLPSPNLQNATQLSPHRDLTGRIERTRSRQRGSAQSTLPVRLVSGGVPATEGAFPSPCALLGAPIGTASRRVRQPHRITVLACVLCVQHIPASSQCVTTPTTPQRQGVQSAREKCAGKREIGRSLGSIRRGARLGQIHVQLTAPRQGARTAPARSAKQGAA